jgi:hypothetical protein
MITFDIPVYLVLSLCASTVFPLLVGLVTKRSTDPGVRAVLLALLAVLSQLLIELAEALQNGTEYNLGTALVLSLVSFLVAVGTHYGLLKPTGLSDKAQAALVYDPLDRVSGPDHSA